MLIVSPLGVAERPKTLAAGAGYSIDGGRPVLTLLGSRRPYPYADA
ncbi:MAG: hypothetical protein AAF151_07900 [Cyanobacteria bacterium J06656_5]